MTPSDLTPSGTRSARDWSAATLGSGVAELPAALPPPPPELDEPPPHPVSANATLVRASAAMAVWRIGVLRDKGGLLRGIERIDLALPVLPMVHLAAWPFDPTGLPGCPGAGIRRRGTRLSRRVRRPGPRRRR